MAKSCTKCGAPLTEGIKFCPKCGAAIGQTQAAPQPTAPPQQPPSATATAYTSTAATSISTTATSAAILWSDTTLRNNAWKIK